MGPMEENLQDTKHLQNFPARPNHGLRREIRL